MTPARWTTNVATPFDLEELHIALGAELGRLGYKPLTNFPKLERKQHE